jgi:AcrR family transcriptional regulator
MPHSDWLVGRDRRTEAAERIVQAAADLVSRRGFNGFTIDALSAEVHCSPATIYRNVGGKAVILERVIEQMSLRVVADVIDEIEGLEGPDRITAAITAALRLLRADPLGPVTMGLIRPGDASGWLTSSPLVSELAEQMLGYKDPAAAQWLIRATLALWYWPGDDTDAEDDLVTRFVGPAFGLPASR